AKSDRSGRAPPSRRNGRSASDRSRGALFSFFAGKGGVGKTTCAAGRAAAAAAEGRRVLVVSTDPAHSLGDALDVRLSGAPKQIARGLDAAELDADRALSRWFGERERAFRVLASRGTYLDDEDVDRLLSQSLPGVDELIGLLELNRLASLHRYDDVVVDTAPTGHTLRLLSMPETLAKFGRVLDDLQQKHRWMAESLRGRYVRDAKDAFPGLPLRLVPSTDEEPRGLDALRRLASASAAQPRAARTASSTPKANGGWNPPDGVRLLLFGGKGGVGKTTCAAACALRLAGTGKLVLLLSTDPAHSLGDALGVALSDEPREVVERLTARELDAD